MEGCETIPDCDLEIYTGCMKNAPVGRCFWKCCKPFNRTPAKPDSQLKVLGVAPQDSSAFADTALRYQMTCYDPDRPDETFDAVLPRNEGPGRPAWIKGHKKRDIQGGSGEPSTSRQDHASRQRRGQLAVQKHGPDPTPGTGQRYRLQGKRRVERAPEEQGPWSKTCGRKGRGATRVNTNPFPKTLFGKPHPSSAVASPLGRTTSLHTLLALSFTC